METSTSFLHRGVPEDVSRVSPAFERHTAELLFGDVWKRPHLSMRDRSLVTLAVLVARHQVEHIPAYLEMALDNGVHASEISGAIAHLAFYSGWGNAMAAATAAQPVFQRRGIDAREHVSAHGHIQSDRAAEERRSSVVRQRFGAVAPGLVQLTNKVLFQDVWLQPELSLRDRCLITICSVIATAQTAQLGFYLNRALDNGLGKAELSEVMTQVAFYSGWSSVYTALAVVKDVFESRPD